MSLESHQRLKTFCAFSLFISHPADINCEKKILRDSSRGAYILFQLKNIGKVIFRKFNFFKAFSLWTDECGFLQLTIIQLLEYFNLHLFCKISKLMCHGKCFFSISTQKISSQKRFVMQSLKGCMVEHEVCVSKTTQKKNQFRPNIF